MRSLLHLPSRLDRALASTRPTVSRRSQLVSLAVLLFTMALVGDVTPASAGECSHPYYWAADGTARIPMPNNCFGGHGFRCHMAIDSSYYFRLSNPNCDPQTAQNGCAVQLRVPLQFPGLRDMIDEEGGLSSSPTPLVFWYDSSPPPPCTISSPSPNCMQDSLCGRPFAGGQFNQDHVETWVERGGITCQNAGQQTGIHSLRAVVCATACRVDTVVQDLMWETLRPEDIGCPEEPPMEACNGDDGCTDCTAGGAGPGGGPPGLGGPGSPPTGPKATLRYVGGGAGFAGLPGSAAWSVPLGRGWSHDYAERIVQFPDENRVFLITKYGTFRDWRQPDAAGVYQVVSPSSEYRTLTWLGAGLGWEIRELDGTVHTFGADGLWLSTTDRNGIAKTATYSGGALASVDFPDGRREDFFYDAGTGKLDSIVEVGVDGTTTSTWSYDWTGDDLTRIGRPDGTALIFTYGDAMHPGLMTRMELEGTDGTSVRVLRGWEYDAEGNVSRTWTGDPSPTGPEAVDVWSFAFDDPAEPTVTTVTDPLDQEITYQLGRDTVSRNVRVESISGDCPTCGLAPNTQLFYEDAVHPLLPTRTVDGRGFETLTSYDAFGQVVSRTEAMGELEERTTTWTYDPTYPALVTSVERPSVAGGASLRTTDWIRDASGNATDRTNTGVEGGSAFSYTTVTTYTAEGQPDTVDPPGHGTDDVTSFTYDPARGNLLADTRTDPLVGTTTFDYDPFNRRTSVLDPNGVETKTGYDELDRVTEVRQVGASPPTDDLVTSYEYTVLGDLFRTTLPRGNVIQYGYDAAGRLESIERKPDGSTPGERTFYTLNDAGSRTLEELQRWDAGSSAWVTVSATAFEYSSRCQVDRIIQAPGTPEEAVTEYAYDCNGNLSDQWDANHDPEVDPPTTSYTYDALDRLTEVSQPWAGGGNAITTYGFDVQGHLTSVTDAEGNVTSYTYSDRDLLTEEASPVSGTTTHGYDEHGELVTTTDARGVTVIRTVDELDRVTFVDYPDDALDTTYAWDAEPVSCAGASFEIGRLGSITRDGQAVEYCYDRFGRTTKDGELVYVYDANGNRTGIGYPGSVSATYGFDFADREVSLDVTTPGSVGAFSVVSTATYLPSGPLSSLALGSGVTETRGFDGRYVPASIGLSGPSEGLGERTWTYTTDRVGNILGIVEQGGCTPGPVVLEAQTVTTEETFTSCSTLEAGNGFAVESPGDVTFSAQATIVLKDGFSVGAGARFVAGSGERPPLSVRDYTYQPPQYFLTGADGPWGELDWSYDRIGNRLAETRDGGSADTYVYLTNGTGNTPILDQVTLGIGGTRDYTWGAAGHLEEVAAGANVLDFGAAADGRLSGVDRTAASETVGFAYDGRSFLRSAQETAGGTSSVEPLYDSAGLVHALRRRPSPSDPEELVVFLHLAGRPVAQVAIAGVGAETWTYLSTDHLGTPLLATDDAGAVMWDGGFEPFGTDYQQGTPAAAGENGIYLRLPGQWEDASWQNATSGAGMAYNVHRWYQPSTGRYNKPDPYLMGPVDLDLLEEGQQPPFAYTGSRPTVLVDPLGLLALPAGTDCQNFNDITRGLEELANNCACAKFFADLGIDLPTLITGAPPFLKTFPNPTIYNTRRRSGFFNCENDPDNIHIPEKFCDRPPFFPNRRVRKGTVAVLHELAHYADCNGNNNEYPGEEGQDAEIACFGKVLSGDVD